MGVSYFLIRSFLGEKDLLERENFLLPFGSQDEVINLLCAAPRFELWKRESHISIGPWATILYSYPHREDRGREVEFSLQGEPVECISTRKAYKEDFLPIIHVLIELAPFTIFNTDVETIKPDELFYSFDDWMQKNYEEDEASFSY